MRTSQIVGENDKRSIEILVVMEESKTRTNRVGFLLVEDFSLLSYASAVEPMRAANHLSGKELFSWCHISVRGPSVRASSGAVIMADHAVGDAVDIDLLLICNGGNPPLFRHAPTFRWLRKLALRKVRLGALSGGSFILARAGLLEGHRFTIHWEHFAALSDEFPDLDVTSSLFEIDRDRLSCAGGIAALDMMNAVIRADHGDLLAGKVSEWFMHRNIRVSQDPQRMKLEERYGVMHIQLLKVLHHMETHLEDPASREQLARRASMSVRQLERLFSAQLGTTIVRHYQHLRLERAQLLLRRSRMSVLDVAVTTGFASASHFSRVYRKHFSLTPREERAGWHLDKLTGRLS